MTFPSSSMQCFILNWQTYLSHYILFFTSAADNHFSLYMLKTLTTDRYNSLNVCVCVASQARESASLRESLRAERESHDTEVDKLRSTLRKLQQQLQEQSQAVPSVTAKQEEEKRRAEERAAEEIHRLTQVCASATSHPLLWICSAAVRSASVN